MTAEQLARNNGFDGVRALPSYKVYSVCEAVYSGTELDEAPAVGYPQLIFERRGSVRWATFDETLDYMEKVDVDDGD